jgi:hypothetical protein
MVAIFADSNRARLRYIREGLTAWGTLPASGSTRELRYTSSSITAAKDTAISEEIRADRMVPDHIETAARSNGDINIEFSAGSHDDFLESFVYGAWTRPMTFDSVKGNSLQWATTSTLYVNGKDVTPYFFAGRRVRTNGFKTPANNDYFQINTITWNAGANRTEIVMTASTAVVEAGSAYTVLYDANDVIVLKNTAIRAGTAGASAFDSNGGNAFAAAIAAGQLTAGQKIFVEGWGFETGSVALTGQIASGDRVKVNDGKRELIFQFGGSGGNSVVVVTIGADANGSAVNLAAAINDQRVKGNLDVSATAAVATVTIKNLNVTGGALTELVDSGAKITVTNFAGGAASIRGVFEITTATDDVLTVTPAPATFANGGSLAVTIKGSMLRNPSNPDDITPQSYTIETGFEDVDQYFVTNGLRVGTVRYNIAANSILTGTIGFNGAQSARSITSVLGASPFTVLQTTSTPVMNATVNVGYINVDGEALSTAVQSIEMNGTNNLRDQNAVSYKFPAGIGAGRMELSGTMVAYFADGALWDKFINHTTVSVSWAVEDVERHHYEWLIPAAVFSQSNVSPQGGNQDVLENMNWMAKRDGTRDCEIQIDRFSCVYPPTA